MDENRRVMVAALPEGRLQVSDFEVVTEPVPEAEPGRVLCRTLALTIGAGQRAGLQGSAGYAGAPQTGVVMGGTGLARVEASDDPAFPVGSLVTGPTGWQDWSVLRPSALTAVAEADNPAVPLGLLGTNGLTAYFGMLDLGHPGPGDTVVVSAAAGSVGHVAGQVARLAGARVVGVTGSEAKGRMLVDELGFDAWVDHRSPTFRDDLKAATPDRIDVYFDNTGGPVLGSALFRMNAHGRIVCCGVVSQYDTSSPEPGPRGIPGLLVNNRVRMEGFLVFDYLDRYDEARAQLQAWADAGDLRARATTYEGLDQAPRAFVDLLAGATVGTTVVQVG